MKAQIRHITDGDKRYRALAFICPGCKADHGTGLHMLPVNTTVGKPSWGWNGDLESVTLNPSILTKYEREVDGEKIPFVCHSFLVKGVFQYLPDCTHQFKDQLIPMEDLPDWFTKETEDAGS